MAKGRQEMAPKAQTNDGWNAVQTDDGNDDAILVRFTEIGDEFIAVYSGSGSVRRSDGSEMRQDRFYRTEDGEKVKYFINTPHALKSALDKVRVGNEVRIQYTDDRETGQASPMKLFAVAQRAVRSA
jgi:hypothetical protein